PSGPRPSAIKGTLAGARARTDSASYGDFAPLSAEELSMWIKSLVRSFERRDRVRHAGPGRRRPRCPRTVLCLEELEDRTVPTVLFEPTHSAEATHYGSFPLLQSSPVYLIFWGSYWQGAAGKSMSASIVIAEQSEIMPSSGQYMSGLGQYGSD